MAPSEGQSSSLLLWLLATARSPTTLSNPCVTLTSKWAEPRCGTAIPLNCSIPRMTVAFGRAETKPGSRLVGPKPGDTYSCYPLSDQDLWRATRSPGNLFRLRDFIRRAKAGEALTVVSVGGSVAHGELCTSYALSNPVLCSWHHRFVLWMQNRYGNTKIRHKNMAVPATTSAWCLSQFKPVLAAHPDLLIVDYGVNDPIHGVQTGTMDAHAAMMRSVTEKIARRFLEPLGNSALVYVDIQRGWQSGAFNYSRIVYKPVCESYGIPLISVKDVIWPNVSETRLALWTTKLGAHPSWSGHQLAADVMSFFFVAAEGNALGAVDVALPPIPHQEPFRFPEAGTAALETCNGRTHLSPPPDSASWLKPVRADAGWAWVDYHGKVGWEFDSDRARHPRRSTPHGIPGDREGAQPERNLSVLRMTKPSHPPHKVQHSKSPSASHGAGKRFQQNFGDIKSSGEEARGSGTLSSAHANASALPGPSGPIISFPVSFNATSRPGLVVDYLRSYNHYGEAVVWVTSAGGDLKAAAESAKEATHFAEVNKAFAATCHQIYHKKVHQFNAADMCRHVIYGTWDDSSILDGQWHFVFPSCTAPPYTFTLHGRSCYGSWRRPLVRPLFSSRDSGPFKRLKHCAGI